MPVPSCVVSADGRVLAVRRGATLGMYALEAAPSAKGGAETPVGGLIAEARLPAAEGTLVFAGGCILDVATADGRTTVTALPSPRLGKVTTIEIPAACRVVADSGKHVLLAAGPAAYLVHVQGESVGYAPMRISGSLDWAIGIAAEDFLTSGSRGVEVWESQMRRPGGKLRLPLAAAPTHVGAATQRRNLWATTAGKEIFVIRISDGKPMRIALPAPLTDPVGHPATSWLVGDLDGVPHAVNLVTGACDRLPAARAAARALAPRGSGALVAQLDERGALELWEIGGVAVEPGAGLRVDVAVGTAPAAEARTAQPTRVALRADVEISLVGGPGRAEPASLARWVDPELERRLAALATHLRRTWLERISDAWLAGEVAPRDRVIRQLVAEARHAARIDGTGEVDDAGRLILPEPWLGEAPAAPWTQLRLVRGDDAVELAAGGGALARLGAALGRLVAGVVPGRDELAIGAGFVTAAPARPTFAGQLEPGTIATLGGSTLLANLAGAHVLVDPRLGRRDAGGSLPAPVAGDLPELAAILLTGDDAASLDVPTLLALDKRATVLVPAATAIGRPAALLADLGFTDVRAVAPGAAVPLGEGATVHVVAAGARIAYVLAGGPGAALAAGAAALDDADVAPLAARLAELAAAGPISPLFLASPRRRRAPIESGWRWLLEPAETWVRGHPATPPRLEALREAARAEAIVITGDDGVVPPDLGAAARLADPYDRHRLGAGQDGWLEPRVTPGA